jgi:hypothetical protein
MGRPKGVPPLTWLSFLDYHRRHPHVWEAFEQKTLRAIERGKVVGAKCIAEAVRYDLSVERKGEYKFCNSFISYYARVFVEKYPRYCGYFKLRPVRGLKA